jgi:hypothetical protein
MNEQASNEWEWEAYGKTKADLPPGPWHDEPDKKVWVDEATGYDCMIVRNPSGALCGYVAVPPGHPNHGKSYWSDEGGPGVDVHGGLTYAAACADIICHVPQPGQPDDVWWFGFDCAHYMDIRPSWTDMMDTGGTYKTIAYVEAEVTSLATQLKELASTEEGPSDDGWIQSSLEQSAGPPRWAV